MKFAYPVATKDCQCNVKAYKGEFAPAFQLLSEQGYEGVELLVKNPDTLERDVLEQALYHYDLRLAAIGTSPMQIEEKLFLIHPDVENRREARRRLSELLKLCAQYQVPLLLGKYRGQLGPEPGCSADNMREMLEDVCEEASQLGAGILLEPQNATQINNLNTVAETMEWVNALQYEKLGIHADTYHMEIAEKSVCESLKLAAGKIGFIHISDSDRKIPGEGTMDFAAIMRTLKDISYQGYLSPEIDQTPTSTDASAQSIRFMKKIL